MTDVLLALLAAAAVGLWIAAATLAVIHPSGRGTKLSFRIGGDRTRHPSLEQALARLSCAAERGKRRSLACFV